LAKETGRFNDASVSGEDGDFERPKMDALGCIRPVWREGGQVGPQDPYLELVSLFVRLQLSLSQAQDLRIMSTIGTLTPFLCAFYTLSHLIGGIMRRSHF